MLVHSFRTKLKTMASVMYCLLSVWLLASQLDGTEAMMTRDPMTKAAAQDNLATEDTHQVHIVYMGGVNERTTTNDFKFHSSMLQEAMGSADDVSQHILYSYTKSFNGFAAVFSDRHAESIRGMEGVVSVFKSEITKPQTTDSWRFLGLSPTQGLWPQSNFGMGTIVGIIDTGVWPESKSFNDDGFGLIPSRWKGGCIAGENFTSSLCNKKLIGAKFYSKGSEKQSGPIIAPEFKSPRDAQGHGTHTSSTAAGRRVADASFLGVANGTATGGAPEARVAMYKACWYESCSDADVLAAFEDAIADGVDLLSISLGGLPMDYMSDASAIGSFHAVAKGIVVSCSAGNSGPSMGTVSNIAPWIFTVGASTTDRVFVADVDLGDRATVQGIALNTFEMNSSYPLVYAGDIPADNQSTADCYSSLNQTMAKEKVILCQGQVSPLMNEDLPLWGSVGYIAITNQDMSVQFDTTMPSTNVGITTGASILKYARSSKNPMAKIRRSTSLFNTTAPVIMGYFSSSGPNPVTLGIHKPDITAPGIDILAAWSPVASPSGQFGDSRSTDFNIITGTSMSCPHVSGLVALVKSVHPDWSPAAIKSAIMTTATPLSASIKGNSPLISGSGQINPTKAADPGLIFNLTTTDYINFLCSIGYNNTQLGLVSGGKATCPKNPPTVQDLNYPSIYVSTNLTVGSFTHNIKRTVTNVGPAFSTYSVSIDPPAGTVVEVEPSTLTFTKINEERSFHVIVTVTNATNTRNQNMSSVHNFGSITWIGDSPNSHIVRILTTVGFDW